MQEEKNSEVFLRPRFRIELEESQEKLLERFRKAFRKEDCNFKTKIVDGHIVFDILEEDNHFWSPQLHVEVEKVSETSSVVKGLFGPKPQVWTLFMFIHFAAVIAFVSFLILFYVKWTVKESTTFSIVMLIGLPILWGILYFLGRLGKSTGKQQMLDLHSYLLKVLES